MCDDHCTDCDHITEVTPGNISVYQHQHVSLVCGGHGPVDDHHLWTLPDNMTGVQEDLQQLPRSYLHKLKITSVNYHHSGSYSCGDVDLNLQVLETISPTINFSNETIYFNLTDRLELKCEGVGTPEPETLWFKDDTEIEASTIDDDHLVFDGPSLRFRFNC